MILISHRGNTIGPIPNLENEPKYIDNAISDGFDVEVDVWCIKNKEDNWQLFLGHDEPQYGINYDWLSDRIANLWVHCKNISALEFLKENLEQMNYFFHQNDDVTITSQGFFWTFPGKELTKNSIACLPEIGNFKNIEISIGICSDFIKKYKHS